MIIYNIQQGHDELQNEDRFHMDGHCHRGESIIIKVTGPEGQEMLLTEISFPYEWRFHCLITAGILEKQALFEPA